MVESEPFGSAEGAFCLRSRGRSLALASQWSSRC